MSEIKYKLLYNHIMDSDTGKSTDDATLTFECSGHRTSVSKLMDAIHATLEEIHTCPEDCPGHGPDASMCLDCEKNAGKI